MRRYRRRLCWRDECILALLPTRTMCVVLLTIDTFSREQLLFASLAASAFLIYLEPGHRTNRARTIVSAQFGAACIGYVAYVGFGSGAWAASAAMLFTIALMIVCDVVHPPAV